MMGEFLLNHASLYRNQTSGWEPIVYLDIEIGDRQMEVVATTAEDLAQGRILQNVAMERRNKMSTRKLNNCGIMTRHCIVINSEELRKRAKDDLCLTDTIESIKGKEIKQSASNKQEKDQGIRDCAQVAAAKVWSVNVSMESRLNASNVTKSDIE